MKQTSISPLIKASINCPTTKLQQLPDMLHSSTTSQSDKLIINGRMILPQLGRRLELRHVASSSRPAEKSPSGRLNSNKFRGNTMIEILVPF